MIVVTTLLIFNVSLQAPTHALTKCIDYTKVGGRYMTVEVACPPSNVEESSSFASMPGKSKMIANGPKLRYEVKYFSECTPDLTLVRSCDAISDPTCPGGGYRVVRTIRAINGPRAGQTISLTQYCQFEPPTIIPGAEDDIAKVTLTDFRKLRILASAIVSQPENFSLRNGHAHIYAKPRTQLFNLTIFDQDVRVQAIPVSYDWSYGDGTSRTLSFPGYAVNQRGFDEPTSTSHVYRNTGDFGVGLSTRFRGEYSTEGGPWTPIPGVANVPSEPITMSVWRTKKILVAENCNQRRDAPGCASLFDR